ARDPGLLGELVADVCEHPLAEGLRVHADVVELSPEVTDDVEVDPALDLREGVVWAHGRLRRVETLVKLHQRLLPIRGRTPVGALAIGAGAETGVFAYRSARLRNAFAAPDCCLAATIGVPSLIERGISRSLGMNTSGCRPTIVETSSGVMPTRESARLRTSETRSVS